MSGAVVRPGGLWWLGGAVCVAAAVANTAYLVAAGDPFSLATLANRGFPFVTLAAVISGVMGSLVLSRRPAHRIGRLLVFCGVVTALSLACDAYAFWVIDGGGSGPRPLVLALSWTASALNGNLTLAGIALVLLLAPDGTLASRRWRPAVAAAVVGAAVWELPPFVEPLTFAASTDPEPTGLVARLAPLVGGLLIVVAYAAAVVSLLRRQRGATGARRAQLRWFTSAAGALAATLAWLLFVRFVLPFEGGAALALVPLMVAVLLFPVAVAIAVLGYRLYDIELIVNRGWLLLGASAFVGAGYVVLVTLVSTSMSDLWGSAVAAAVLACAFQPLRVRLVQLADRLAYGDQALPYLALADLSRRLRHTPDQARLLRSVAEACSRAAGATAARIDLFDVDGSLLATATAPDGAALDEARATRLDVRYWGEVLGALWVQPAAGRALRRRDLLVLEGFSEQAGVALRNLRLDDELAERVAELAEVVAGLRESRDRVLRAREDQLAALEEALASEVVPRLDATAALLHGCGDPLPGAHDDAWARVDAELTAARERLRALSHGLHPGLLEAEGLGPALRSLLHRAASPAAVVLADDLHGRRFGAVVEAVVYRSVAHALASGARLERVVLEVEGPDLAVALSGAGVAQSVGAQVRDLVEGSGGTLGEHGGAVTLRVPLTPDAVARKAR